ncbi:TPA: hypothetical protein ACHW2M_004480 [Yersinia enterocolitica]|nr:hypothetical protein [Yersinia enterocolitica]
MLSKEQLEVISKLGDGGYLNYLSDGSFAEMATELLSLREQLAELKAVQPVAEMRTWPKNISGPNPDWFWFGKQDFPVGTQLFTAAKPVED